MHVPGDNGAAGVRNIPSSVTPVVEFITQKFMEGKQYSTLNSLWSALSATIPPIEGQPVGQHPLVCRALQGSFN